MTLTETPFYGVAVFGTARGLSVIGNGILANPNLGIFEMRKDDGGPVEVLHFGGLGTSAMFRRPLQAGGKFFEMIGHLAACKDSEGRDGFFGYGVVIDADRFEPDVAVYDWIPAIQHSSTVFQELRQRIDLNKVEKLPGRLVRPANDRPMPLKVRGRGDYALFNIGSLDPEKLEVAEYFRAKAFTDRSVRSLFLFEENLRYTRAIDDGGHHGLPEQMRAKIEEIRREQSRAQNLEKHPDEQGKRPLRILEPYRDASRRPEIVEPHGEGIHRRVHQASPASLEERVAAMERRMVRLEQLLEQRPESKSLWRRAPQAEPHQVQYAEDVDGQGGGFLTQLLLGVAIMALAGIAVVAGYIFIAG